MLLAQVFKTYEGALKKAQFESTHSKTHSFMVVRFYNGFVDVEYITQARLPGYTWQIQKLKR